MEKCKGQTAEKSERGFSLIESILSLSIFLIIVLSSLEFFGFTRNLFLKLKAQQETSEAALATLDKMRTDLLAGGQGLQHLISLGLLEGIAENEDALIILSKEKSFPPLNNLVPGQTRIQLESTSKLKKGREICIFDSNKGEVKLLSSVDKKSAVLSSPLNFSYQKEETSIFLLKKISLFLDKNKQTLRRKVNSSSPQPLLEEVIFFDFFYEKPANLVRLRLGLKAKKEKEYEISVFPKNTALTPAQ